MFSIFGFDVLRLGFKGGALGGALGVRWEKPRKKLMAL